MMVRPLWCLFGVLTTYTLAALFFSLYPILIEEYFFITIYSLVGLYTAYAIFNDKTKYDSRSWLSAMPKAVWKYLFWALILWSAIWIYSSHSFYESTFPRALAFIEHFFQFYLYLGFFYFLLSEKFRHSLANTLQDPVLRFLSLGRLFFRGDFRKILIRIKKEPYRNFFTACMLRMHFMPIMVDGLYGLNTKLFAQLSEPSGFFEPLILVALITNIAWCIDCNNGAIGYFWESNFTKTKFRKVDPYPLHWIITLSCYIPFINLMDTFVHSPLYPERTDLWVNSPSFLLGTDLVIMVLVIGYTLAGTSLAFSWSNLSYKGIQTRGIYSIIRHPGTFFKLSFFAVMIFRYESAQTVSTAINFVGWIIIYLARTLCEERFLKNYPEYCDYMKKTRYRVIPGVF